MRRIFMVLVLILQPAVIAADGDAPVLKINPPKQVGPNEFFELKLDSNCRWHEWTIPPGLNRVPIEMTAVKEKGFVGAGPSGVYEFKVRGSLNDVHVETKCVVFVGTPQPGPIPPIPPAPSDLVGELQLLFTADKGTADQRDKLTALWRSSAEQVEGNPKWTSLGAFAQAMHAVASDFPFNLTDEVLKSVRTKLANEITSSCGPGTTELGTPGSVVRKKAAAILNKYSAALGGVK